MKMDHQHTFDKPAVTQDPEAILKQAGQLLDHGQLEEAQILYRQVLAQCPDHPVAFHFIGVVASRQGDHRAAVEWIAKALSVQPDYPDARNNLGIVFLNQGCLEEAGECFRKVLELDPDHINALNNLGVILLGQGRLAEAEDCFRQVLANQPEHVDAGNNLGIILMNQGRLMEAGEQFQQVLSIKPKHADAQTNSGIIHMAQGDLEKAAEFLSRALAINPNHPEALVNMGFIHQHKGRMVEAGGCFRQSLAVKPTNPEVLNNLGVISLNEGKLKEATDYFRKALALRPDYADAYNNLGSVAMRQGLPEEAVEHFRKALAINPDHADANNNMGGLLFKDSRLAEAVQYLERALTVKPDSSEALNNLGQIYLSYNQFEDARECFRKALAIHPRFVEAINNVGTTYLNDGQLVEAEEYFRQALAINADHADTYNNLGAVYLNRGQPEEAVNYFRQALELNPDHPSAHSNLGVVLQQQGKMTEAAKCFKEAIRILPKQGEAYRHLVNCYKIKAEGEEIQQIESLLQDPNVLPIQRIPLHFALGKSYDDIGDFDRAFMNYAEANRLWRADLDSRNKALDMDQFSKYVDNIIEAFPQGFFSGDVPRASESEVPVFIVGMFRSGTTLVEQIIASHSRAFGAGELKKISQIVAKLQERLGCGLYPEGISRLDHEMVKGAANEYLDYVTHLAGPTERITDKMPNNIWQLGLIAMMFPNAKIIYCRRDPKDICLSCFFQRFTDEVPYSTDLRDSGKFYLETERIARHWKSVLPMPILEVEYERLVDTPQRESRRIIDFIGLEWEDNCLNFHKTRRNVSTASVWQVRQPIYTKSVKRWQRYAKHIKPLLEVLNTDSNKPS
ncbi:tetratricopeptide repeat protein [Methylohalobius crimeensis]|uniref:tetratricopeptide repeat protein n=1 Tax=Methylohalobius crimeensis TaxID=244365 RepID=UPI000A04AB8D|nr:tetratricopeptide repeat protein [Methylohalobius crimeensis]